MKKIRDVLNFLLLLCLTSCILQPSEDHLPETLSLMIRQAHSGNLDTHTPTSLHMQRDPGGGKVNVIKNPFEWHWLLLICVSMAGPRSA